MGWKMLNLSTEGFAKNPCQNGKYMLWKNDRSLPYYKENQMLSWRSRCGWFSTTDATGLGFPTNPIAPSAAFLGGSQKFKSSECGIRCLFFAAKKCMNFYVPRPEAILQVSPNIAPLSIVHLELEVGRWRHGPTSQNCKWTKNDVVLRMQPSMQIHAVHPLQKWGTWCLELFGGVLWIAELLARPAPPPCHPEDNQISNSSDITGSWL